MTEPARTVNEIPADLHAIDGALAEMARRESLGAPSDLTARLWSASRGMLPPREPLVVIRPRAANAARWFTPVRMAAAIAVAGVVVAVRLAGIGVVAPSAGPELASIEADVESLLTADLLGDGLTDLGQRIDLIFADVATFSPGEGGDDPWIEGGAL